MFRLYLGASGLQIYSAPSGGQGADLSHDPIVRIFTWLEKNENTSVVNRGGDDAGCGGRTDPRNKRVFIVGTNTGAAGAVGGAWLWPRDQLQPPPSRVCHSSPRDEGHVKLNMGPVAVRLSPW